MYVEIRDIQPQVEMRKTVFFGCVFSAYFHIPFQQIHTQSVEYGRSIGQTYFPLTLLIFSLSKSMVFMSVLICNCRFAGIIGASFLTSPFAWVFVVSFTGVLGVINSFRSRRSEDRVKFPFNVSFLRYRGGSLKHNL